jgi:hypothetical protein
VPTKWLYCQDLFQEGTYRENASTDLPVDIHQWWEKNCDSFIWKEEELRGKFVKDIREFILYSERSSDQYNIFWVKFLEELFHWIERLQEALEFHE